jgi:glycerol-3-phosphate acyltransferase PlsY
MPAPIQIILVIVGAYLIGAIPSGLIIGRVLGRDPMKSGSGKTGANNTFQTAGPAAGIAVLVLDLLKGLVVVALTDLMGWPNDAWAGLAVGAAGAAAIIGHNWSVWVRLLAEKWGGGRGIMTAFGAVLTVSIWVGLAALIAGGIVLFATRYMVWAVIVGAMAAIGTAIVLGFTGLMPVWLVPGAIVWCLLVVVGFHDNIERLLSGTETKIGSTSSS